MIGAERQSGVNGVSDQVTEVSLGEAVLLYNGCSLLTIKNPNNKLDKEELMRVAYSFKSIIGFSTIYYLWYEMGKQKQQHIHMIIKKKFPSNPDELRKYSKSFKQRKLKYLKYFGEAEQHSPWGIGDMVEYEIDTSQCNFLLSKIENQSHLAELIYEYRWKELDPDFIDD